MSSTNRGGVREVSDYYVTPKEHIRLFLKEFMTDMAYQDTFLDGPGPHRVLDPCAGGDKDHGMSYPEVLAEWKGVFDVHTWDIREDSRAMQKGLDFLTTEIHPTAAPSMIITNPPFALAAEIIAKAIRDVAPGGFVIMLLRLNYFGSRQRFEFLKRNMPWRVYVHSRRMKFISGKSGDSIEYAHFVWRQGRHPAFSELKVIDFEDTPNEADIFSGCDAVSETKPREDCDE